MSRMAHRFSAGAVIAILLCVPAAAAAQGPIPARVRVLTQSERILRWLGPQTDIILVVDQGTILEVLDFDQEKASYWVILPPDLHGTRKAGWIRASAVEPAAGPSTSPEEPPASLPGPPASASEPYRDSAHAPASASGTAAATEDTVSLSVRRDGPAGSAGDVAAARKSYSFEDVHFERDRSSLRTADLDGLRVAAAALRDDPSLVVTIEGHTCSLGSGAYNLALGSRRADAVKQYLVSAGVPAERLLTVSQGEAGAAHDNSQEETRRLNRRVALVPRVPR